MPTKTSEALVLTSKHNGIVVIPMGTELTRLNYFDGKFLRASDLKAEQDYLRHLVQESNRAGGSGVAHGFDVTFGGGDTLNIGPGLAIDAEGRVLLMPQSVNIGIQDLINKSRGAEKVSEKGGDAEGKFAECEEIKADQPVNVTNPDNIYQIVICPAEAFCGEEDVYGKLCEEACSTSTDRPLIIEGVVIRAIPLGVSPTTKGQLTQANLRSRTAAAYFEHERNRISNLISADGLKQQIWCLGANAETDGCVPIGVFARAGTATVFLDPWIVRRELMDTPARRYWQWRMMMRPWNVFLAQILQFQCQLRDLFKNFPTPGTETGPCSEATDVLNEASVAIAEIYKYYEATAGQLTQYNVSIASFEGGGDRLLKLNKKLDEIHKTLSTVPADRWLINGGIIELPSAGYLPVVPNGNVSVNQQVQKMMGEGVDLRFCVVRPDYVAHALEEAQHMERISLIEGLDDAKKRPQVDILVPDGELVATQQPDTRQVYATDFEFALEVDRRAGEDTRPVKQRQVMPFKGAASVGALPSGGKAFYLAATTPVQSEGRKDFPQIASMNSGLMQGESELGMWVTLNSEHDLMQLKSGDKTKINLLAMLAPSVQAGALKIETAELKGELTVGPPVAGWTVAGAIAATYSLVGSFSSNNSGSIAFDFRARQPSATSIEINFTTTSGRTTFAIEADWTNPASVMARLAVELNLTESTKLTYEMLGPLNKDADVFSPNNVNHAEAIQALQYLGAAQPQKPNFVAENTDLLFPPAPSQSSAAVLRATRDWVLFHRRRNKQCEQAKEHSRRYRVYQFAATPQNMKKFRIRGAADLVPPTRPTQAELEEATPRELEQFRAIGEVAFTAGGASFDGDLTTLKNAWQKINGAQILWGAIGSRGDAANDGETLSRNRLQALEAALDKVSPTARADVLPIVPSPLEDVNFDGVILLINGIFLPGYYYDYYGYYGYYGSGLAMGIGAGNLKPSRL